MFHFSPSLVLAALMLANPAATTAGVYDFDDVELDFGRNFVDRLTLEGTINLREAQEKALIDRLSEQLALEDFQLTLKLDVFDGTQVNQITHEINPDNTFITLNGEATRLNDGVLFWDTTGLAPGTPLINIDTEKLGQDFGFPDGRRFGEDETDILIMQVFSGSVNFGLAGFQAPKFPFDPLFVQTAQITPEDRYTFATLQEPTPVPVPMPALLLLVGLGFLPMVGGVRRRV